eukprot:GSChrysophyteH1.ASY1.ANO1.25.1 assembled CDS
MTLLAFSTGTSHNDVKQARRRMSTLNDKTGDIGEGIGDLSIGEKNNSPKAGASSNGGFIVNSYGGYSKKGYAPYNPKKKNQDALVMAEDPKTRSLFLCVMDGHGEDGDKVTQNIKGKLANYLFNHRDFATDVKAAISDVIARCETEILRDSKIETDFSGTTFVCAVIRGNKCIMANIGDSRTSLAYRHPTTGEVTAVNLTIDHKPDLPAEKARIQAKGGRVFAVEYDDGVDGPARVWLGHMDVPGLAMSRSLGDVVAHSAGVSSEPEFFEYEFNKGREDIILVLASDGLWEFMTDQEVMDVALNTTEPRFAVDHLISESNERWMKEEQVIDDTTVCVAFLSDFQQNVSK